ncbi:hypothetical protein BAUCODRAFT_147588 [Baudoinia panamericana UAMH 10762]|uniref:BZIP domain-containing protein n=1 Tax=Baudoinia panamericana (strain UAMH 10762) TaxID=717646 RepID=M2NEY8_BAUPA|nr:uncharacterized protein BAUCODRAFT_147588 [Baudoinia panamericana UAMH 10762]EMC97520.1 hypothetical protein BAUCODRAFT_147588 [Baudoinia panamericana UAMH 10762]
MLRTAAKDQMTAFTETLTPVVTDAWFDLDLQLIGDDILQCDSLVGLQDVAGPVGGRTRTEGQWSGQLPETANNNSKPALEGRPATFDDLLIEAWSHPLVYDLGAPGATSSASNTAETPSPHTTPSIASLPESPFDQPQEFYPFIISSNKRTRRQEQNQRAQRAYRARQKRLVTDLEAEVNSLKNTNTKQEARIQQMECELNRVRHGILIHMNQRHGFDLSLLKGIDTPNTP